MTIGTDPRSTWSGRPTQGSRRAFAFALAAWLAGAGVLHGQSVAEPFAPTPGMPGKDAVWVPTSPELVETMLDLAGVTSEDYVIDLGSGDGRMVIAAARRGARALGVEFNPDLVGLSTRLAREAGVDDRATFVEGDMFTADISEGTVLALFLLPEHLQKLTPNFLALPPGSRIVVNTFGIPDWQPARVQRLEGECTTWCEARLYLVPAPVSGQWQVGDASLRLDQAINRVSGTLITGDRSVAIEDGIVQGGDISFTAGGDRFAGRIQGDTIEGIVMSGGAGRPFTAARRSR